MRCALAGDEYRVYVNIGGGVASLGSSHNKMLVPNGLSFELGAHNYPRKGCLILMADQGIPVLHMLNVADLARANGLPVAPDYLPQPGEGEIFIKEMYRLHLALIFLVIYCSLCTLILAPELRRGLFDRWTRKIG